MRSTEAVQSYPCRFRGARGFIVGKGLAAAAVSFWIQQAFLFSDTWDPPPGFGCASQSASFFACGSELVVELAIAMLVDKNMMPDRQTDSRRQFERFREDAWLGDPDT